VNPSPRRCRFAQLVSEHSGLAQVSLVAAAVVITLALVLGGPSPLSFADNGDPCDIASDENACGRVSDGAIMIGTETGSRQPELRGPVDGVGKASRRALSPQELSVARQIAVMCMTAQVNAAARGSALPPEVAALCAPAPAAPAPAPAPVVITAGMVLRAFRELPLYRGAIRTDPVGWTLVNLDTYFWCADGGGQSCADLGEPEQVITLLGRQVRIRPHVTAYTWRFGDGTAETADAGRVTHVYRSGTTAVVTVTLSWSAEYSVGGGGFQPIGGTTTTTSEPLVLPVREARPVLVGGGGV
jgi:hypothetical protein